MKDTKEPIKSIEIVTTQLVKERVQPYETSVTSVITAACYLLPFFRGLDREAFYLMCLNNRNDPTNISLISLGSSTSAQVEFMQIFKVAILSNSNRFIVAHNHVSGSKEISKADESITFRLKQAGMIMGIELLDHLIFYGEGPRDFISLKDEGHI
ncbi:MAG: JAB domain-containing protein [Gracilimonas sp.]|uniref:JAB domain-containing protein n=1 Tax=Gracilimonas sp. TaxID=1974203 RepID=UPI0019B855D8|nr:JAB domain-containing protein [Gracilimonas sp.]MBD3615852.1 JAB domain-containing protein [Gracilimonas sp.]